MACDLYRVMWIMHEGYVLYRHCFDEAKCSRVEGAIVHRVATFVDGREARYYAAIRNKMTEENGTDALPDGT